MSRLVRCQYGPVPHALTDECQRVVGKRDQDAADRLSSAAAIYRYEGDATTALRIEAVLHNLDNGRAVRVVDLQAAHALADAVLPPWGGAS